MSFRRSGRRGRNRVVLLDLDADERDVLTTLFTQVAEMIEASDPSHRPVDPEDARSDAPDAPDALAALVGIGTATSLPLDPALARLFPNAYNDDAIAAGDFRRYTEQGLRRRKLEHVAAALATLEQEPPVALEPDVAGAWLGALNDLRLVLGSRLDVHEDDGPDTWAEDPDEAGYHLYQWLTMLQGDLLAAID